MTSPSQYPIMGDTLKFVDFRMFARVYPGLTF